MPSKLPVQDARKALARAALSRRSVSLDSALRFQEQKAIPHFYPFIPYPYQFGSPATDGSGFYTVGAVDAEGPDGIVIPAGGVPVTIPVRLDRDADFHMLWIKYVAHIDNPTQDAGPPIVRQGSREFLVQPATSLQAGRTPFVASWYQRVPWLSYLDVSVYLLDAGSRDYYGGLQADSMSRDMKEFPMPIYALQTAGDGVGQVRLQGQLSASGVVLVKATNRHPTQAIRLNGAIFGYKVFA